MVLTFDGNEIKINSNINWGANGVFTFCAWATCDDTETREGRLFSKNDGTGTGDHVFCVDNNDEASPAGLSLRLNGQRDIEDDYLTEGVLYHIAVVYDKDLGTEIRLYRNGLLYASVDNNTGNLEQNAAPVSIGNSAVHARPWKGNIEDVRIYDRALSQAEITTIYNGQGRDKIIDSLVQHWPLSEKTSGTPSGTTSIKNRVRNGETGNPVSAPTYLPSILRI